MLAPIGCANTKKLEPGGAYAPAITTVDNGVTNTVAIAAPDKGFYAVDAAFDLVYSTVDAAFTFERDNRLLLWKISPEIKHQLDVIRPQAAEALQKWALARDAYMRNPTPAGLTTLQTVLGQMRQISQAAQAVLPKE